MQREEHKHSGPGAPCLLLSLLSFRLCISSSFCTSSFLDFSSPPTVFQGQTWCPGWDARLTGMVLSSCSSASKPTSRLWDSVSSIISKSVSWIASLDSAGPHAWSLLELPPELAHLSAERPWDCHPGITIVWPQLAFWVSSPSLTTHCSQHNSHTYRSVPFRILCLWLSPLPALAWGDPASPFRAECTHHLPHGAFCCSLLCG